MKSFRSISVEEEVAQNFMSQGSNTVSVLMILYFPTTCGTAIQFPKLSKKLPSILEFEGEKEVLALPLTMFHVTRITAKKSSGQYTVYLENVIPRWNILRLLLDMRKEFPKSNEVLIS